MSRNRAAVVAAVLVLFAVVAAYLVYKNQGGGGQNVRFDITVSHADTMKPSELKVHQNDLVTISITSDTDGEVHLHGYDIHFDNTPGKATTQTFKADKSGTFDIEWESTGVHLGDLVVAP